MSIYNSLQISIFGLSIVFIVLIGLSFLVKLQSLAVGKIISIQKASSNKKEIIRTITAVQPAEEVSVGELALVDVTEKTAAMIMAIVSDETKIPLSELRFKSIKAMD